MIFIRIKHDNHKDADFVGIMGLVLFLNISSNLTSERYGYACQPSRVGKHRVWAGIAIVASCFYIQQVCFDFAIR